ncbi:MAG TPA: hypothetical protein VFV68_13025 [Agriterribacter sp.]|nr:hypothetical protein [Agriterribacter sp.]
MKKSAKAAPDIRKLVEFRNNAKMILFENPNYFGVQDIENKAILNFKPVINLLQNTTFEDLTCVSYNPKLQRLSANIKILQNSGYGGGPCTDGSKEYVRFFVSYDNGVTWDDEGVVDFDAHDLGPNTGLCYELGKTFTPKKKSCCDKQAVLPLVRAILSWNTMPPAGAWWWLPIWGKRLDAYIQIAPSKSIICYFDKLFEKIDIQLNAEQFAFLENSAPDCEFTVPDQPIMSIADLKRSYAGKVEDARIGHLLAYSAIADPAIVSENKFELFKKYNLDLKAILAFLKLKKFNVGYEEVKCVGLNRNFNLINASLQIKRPTGYSGGLCTTGSTEYLAYYMDFGAGWVYMGTSSVNVHDIPTIPKEGLWYNAPLAVNLTPYQKKWCETGKAKIKVILSWNVVPPINPNWVAPWGDWEECVVEIKPLPKGVPQEEIYPFIELLGGMPVDLISNVTGNASGLHTLGFTANDSPFDGNITIRGRLFNQNNHNFKYRLMVTEPGTGIHPIMDQVKLKTDTFGTISPQLTLTPSTPDGWIDYLANPFTNTVIVDDIFGNFIPTKNGIHTISLEFWDTTDNVVYNSNTVAFNVDKIYPDVDIVITSGTGDCGDFAPGDLISGIYSITDLYCHSMSINMTPAAEAAGSIISIDGVVTSSLSFAGGTLAGTGQSGTWQIQTPSTIKPCGYNVWIHGYDRTIVNSSGFFHYSPLAKGFCIG